MTDTPPQEPVAAPDSPPADQVEIALGPDLGIYPPELRPASAPEPTSAEPPEATEPAAPPTEPSDAGPEQPSPQTGDDGQGSRRQRGQEAYERGLAEGRAAMLAEQQAQQRIADANEAQRAATQRVEQLFAGLESPDRNVQEQARRGVLELYRGNQQATALQTTTRQQILMQMAQDFAQLRGADGVDDKAYEQLHTAANPAELVQRAMALGRSARDDEVQKLQAELTQLRGRLVGQTPSPSAGNGTPGTDGITIEQYRNMSPAEARKLSPRQIDALTAALAREAQYANGRA